MAGEWLTTTPRTAYLPAIDGLRAFAGVLAWKTLPIDAFPDVTNVQVQVLATAGGFGQIARVDGPRGTPVVLAFRSG